MLFVFGPGFELDVAARELRHRGQPIPLQPKVFDTLRYLVENRDRVVPKQELLDALWNGETLNPIAVPWSVSHARKALEHLRGSIKTVRGEGYRFVAEAHRVASVPAERPTSPHRLDAPSLEPFVGRDDAVERLTNALHDARAGTGRLVLVVGDAGIGKSECVRALGSAVQRSGARVWEGRAAGVGAPAFWPWIQILRDVGSDKRVTGVERRAAEAVVARLAPAGPPPSSGPRGPALADSSRFWLSEAVAQALLQTAELKVRVLVFEDLHDADDGSLEALALLAPKLAQAKLLVVVTARPEFLTSERQRGAMRLRPDDTVVLSGLTLADIQRYVSAALGRVPSPEVVRAVFAGTQGNPLFLKEAVRILAARSGRDADRTDDLGLPDVVQQLVHRRIAALDASTREVLDAAAVLGNDFQLGELKRMLGLTTEDLLGRMESAQRARFVGPASDDGTHAFAHALVRDAFYAALGPIDRKRLHAHAAAALEANAVVRPRLGAIAHHLRSALPEADAGAASDACRVAGDAAMDLFGYEDAAQFYTWALEARGYDERAPDPSTASALLLASALAARRAGRVRATRDACRRAIELAVAADLPEVLLKAARILRPTVWIALVPDSLALRAVERALPLLPPAGRARASSLLAFMPPYSLDIARSRALGEEAVRTARELGDRSLLLESLVATFHGLSGPATLDELLAAADEVLQLDGPELTWWSAEAFFARHHALLQRGDAPGAERALRAFRACGERLRMPEAIWQSDRIRAQDLLYTGDFAGAEQRFHELFARGETFRTYALFQYAAQMNALSWERDGKVLESAGLGTPDVAWKWAAALPLYRVEGLHASIQSGARADALAEFNALVKDDFAAVSRDMSYLYVLARLATAAVALDQPVAARALYTHLLPYARYTTVNSLSLSLGSVSHFLGVLAAHLGEPVALTHFAESMAHNAELGHAVHARASERAIEELVARQVEVDGPLPIASFKLQLADRRVRVVPERGLDGCVFSGPGVDLVGDEAAAAIALAEPVFGWLRAREPVRVRSASYDVRRARFLATVEAEPLPRVVRIDPDIDAPSSAVIADLTAPLLRHLGVVARDKLAARPR